MKKNIIKLFLCSALVLSATACRDALDIVQEGELTKDNIFKSTGDVRAYLDGDVYTSMSLSSQISFASLFTDEVGIGPAFSGFNQDVHQFYVDISTGQASGIWNNNYLVINRALSLLEGASLVKPSASVNVQVEGEGYLALNEAQLYNSYLAETRTIRALAYIQLLQHFSTDISDPNALGVILLDHVPTIDEQLPRSSNADIYKVIEDDLNFAAANIQKVKGRNNTQYFISDAMISAVQARYYLYRKNYPLAKQYAQKTIDASKLQLTIATPVPAATSAHPADRYNNNWHKGINAYTTANSYMKMMQDTDRGEVIFALSRPSVNSWENIAGLYASNSSTASGSIYDMGRNLFNILDKTDGDIRKYVYIDPTSKILPGDSYLTDDDYRRKDVLAIDKYPGKVGVPLRNDIKVFRLSEMYFILAEAAAQDNNFTEAANRIYDVRVARNFKGTAVKPSYSSKVDALKDILKERRVELAFEGHRFIDLKRVGPITGEVADRSPTDAVSKEVPLSIPLNDYRFTLPIPRSELQGNTVIQQNPGYRATP